LICDSRAPSATATSLVEQGERVAALIGESDSESGFFEFARVSHGVVEVSPSENAADYAGEVDAAEVEEKGELSAQACPAIGDFRSRYIGRLASARAWTALPQRPPAHQTVTIFDWDDTLLCTSWLSARLSRAKRSWFRRRRRWKLDADTAADLALVEDHATSLLSRALKMGHAFIVTNAGAGWVEESAAMWAPKLLPFLRRVEVISAREGYEQTYPMELGRWKVEAFLELQRKLPESLVTNLIVVGDSEFEMIAARHMREQFQHAVLKAVKFLSKPSPIQLLAQMEFVSECFGKIEAATKDLMIDLNFRHRD